MNRADTLVIVLLLSMIAGFLAVPFTQWLCETIYLLKGWEKSRGTKMELAEALRLNLMIWPEE